MFCHYITYCQLIHKNKMSTKNNNPNSRKRDIHDNDNPTIIQICEDVKKDYDDCTTPKGERLASDNDDIEIVCVQGTKSEVPDEIQIVKVTPPKKKRIKIGNDGIPRTEILTKNTRKETSSTTDTIKKTTSTTTEDDSDDESGVDYLVIKSLSCKNGSNVLTHIPGGYTEHWKCPIYIEMLHRSLYYEMKIWGQSITDFVDNIDQRLKGTVYDCGWDPKQGEHIKKFVRAMERVVKNKVLQKRSIILHSLNYQGIMHALPGCTKEMAKIVYNMCRSATFHVRFMVMMGPGPDGMTYDIGTLFSVGCEWSFGQWDNRTLF